MKNIELPGVQLLTNRVFHDERGYFMESYRRSRSEGEGGMPYFVQDNLSCSSRHVFRGMHMQRAPYGQAKLIRVAHGALVDFVLDVDPTSPTYGASMSFELSGGDGYSLFIPACYAHGFLALEDETVLLYKASQYYHPDAECCYHFSALGEKLSQLIDPTQMIVARKDLQGQKLI